MDKLVDWLAHNSAASITLTVAFGLLAITVTVIYAVAFSQGREVSFWPPKIGAKPAAAKEQPSQTAPLDAHVPLMLDKRSILVAASGERYEIGTRLYSGSTAGLFLASSKVLPKVVAKVYWVGPEPNSPVWESFNRELRVSEILQHRNIVRVFDRGIAGGYPFLIMEYLAGGTLRDWLDAHDQIRGGPLLSISTQIADAIDFAHSRGVLHRDLKPGNVLLESDESGRVAVSDFGIARLLGAAREAITAENMFAGTIAYIAPEALRGENPTTDSDVYAFGVILFEMITRSRLYGDLMGFALAQKILAADAPDIRDFRPVSERLSERIRSTLSRDRQKRPSSARAVLSGIESELLAL